MYESDVPPPAGRYPEVRTDYPATAVQTLEPPPMMPVAPVASLAPLAAPRVAPKMSWGGLLGGIVVAVGVWLLLTVLGLAIGLSSFDPSDTLSAVKNIGISAGIWSIIVSVIALFVGGIVASRSSGILDRPTGAIHGAALWSIATVLSIFLVGGVVRNVVRGAAQIAVNIAAEPGSGMGTGMGTDTQDLGRGALTAADAVGHAMWWVFLSMLLGLVAAVLGSTLGVSRKQRIAAGVVRPPLATTREAYP